MTQLSISVDLKPFKRFGVNLENTKRALAHAGVVAQKTWIEYASGAAVNYSGGSFVINRITGQYVRSIETGLQLNAHGNPWAVAVVSDSRIAPYNKWIEYGVRSHDMKTYLLYGDKAKKGKSGIRYLTVSFRDRAGSISGGSRSGGMQFRRVSENSSGWIHPGTPPRPVTKALKENLEGELKDIIRKGMVLDLAGTLSAGE